jgi:hypothetical protein
MTIIAGRSPPAAISPSDNYKGSRSNLARIQNSGSPKEKRQGGAVAGVHSAESGLIGGRRYTGRWAVLEEERWRAPILDGK